MRLRRRWITIAVFGMAACTSSTEPGASGPSLHFSGSVGVTDTVNTLLPQALLVDVRDSAGKVPPVGTIVRFSSISNPPNYRTEARVAPLDGQFFNVFTTSTTDASGRAGVLIQLGNSAGAARVVVSVPAYGLQDTARFTVTAGKAMYVTILPADTAVSVGKSVTLSGAVVDQWGNPRTDPVTWTSAEPGITTTNGGVVTATEVGRYHVAAASGGRTAVGLLTVVPQALFAGLSGSGYGPFTILALDSDGSNRKTIASGSDGGIGAHPAWIPGTNKVVYTTYNGIYQLLYTASTDAAPKLFFGTAPANVTHQADPTPSADGKWLYFIAYDTRCSAFDYCVARSKIDGSEYELLVTTPSRQPAPSPDGSKVAYTAGGVGGGVVRVLDVASKTTSSWSVSGRVPAWSPDGTQIAYVNSGGALSVVAPDGTGARTLSPTIFSNAIPAWSPDSKWLVVNSGNTSVLVNVATGVALPLPYTNYALTVTSVK